MHPSDMQRFKFCFLGKGVETVRFNVPRDTLHVISETIFRANDLSGAKTWSSNTSLPIAKQM